MRTFLDDTPCTRERPGTRWHLLAALALADGVLPYDVHCYQLIQQATARWRPASLMLQTFDGAWHTPFGSRLLKGGILGFECGGEPVRGDQVFKKIQAVEYRLRESFPSFMKLQMVGAYKDDLGQGFHAMCNVYEFEGKFYAPDIECGSSWQGRIFDTLNLDRHSIIQHKFGK